MGRTARIAVLVILKLAVLGGILTTYALDLASGREIVLRTQPVDPRSLFRGFYVRLGYPITSLEGPIVGEECYEGDDTVFVTLARRPGDDGRVWRPFEITRTHPGIHDNPDRVTLRARVSYASPCPADGTAVVSTARPTTAPGLEPAEEPARFLTLDYGISAYFASPEQAKALEANLRNNDRVEVVLSVPKSGRALIKGVIVNGERILQTGLL